MACTCHGDADAALLAAAVLDTDPAVVAGPRFADPFPVPEAPPASWFDEPEGLDLVPGQKATAFPDGRVAGYFYDHGACLIHMHDACPKPSPTRYAALHQGDLVTREGDMLHVGVIGNTHGHAHERSSVATAQAHYADPSAQLMIVRAGDNDHGGWIAGALVPGLTYGDVALIRRSALSGDWRPMPSSWWQAHGIARSAVLDAEGYDCIGPTLVTRPGLPLVRQYARTAAALARWIDLEDIMKAILPDGTVIEGTTDEVEAMMASLTAAPPPPPPPPAEDDAPAEGPTTAELDARLSEIEAAVAEIVAMINESAQSQAAAIAASVIPLPEMTNA